MNKEAFNTLLNNYNELKEVAEDLLKWYHDTMETVEGFGCLIMASINHETIEYEGKLSYGSDAEYYYCDLPIDLLYDKTAIEREKALIQKNNEIKERRLKETEKKQQRELAELKRLKEKYNE